MSECLGSYDRVGETFDSVIRLSPQPTSAKLPSWRGRTTDRQTTKPPSPPAATPAPSSPSSRVNLVSGLDSQDRLGGQIVGSQETLTGNSPAISATDFSTEVTGMSTHCTSGRRSLSVF